MRCRECHKETGTISATTGLCNECDTKYREKHKGDIEIAKNEIMDTLYDIVNKTIKDNKQAFAFNKLILKSVIISTGMADDWIKAKEEFDNDSNEKTSRDVK